MFVRNIWSNEADTDIGDNIPNSLMLDSSLSQYLGRATVGLVDTNPNKKTYSLWTKLGKLGVDRVLLSNYYAATFRWYVYFGSDNALHLYAEGGSTVLNLVSTQLFRDASAHYHIHVATDSTLATAADRVQVSVNGVRITSWTTNTPATQNNNWAAFIIHDGIASFTQLVGGLLNSSSLYDGYLSSVICVDGQTLGPNNFGRFSTDTGQWVPKNYIGTYGTNGFKLDFTNGTALGTDSSGNGNNWVLNGSITSANQYTDTPTNNYAVLNALYTGKSTLSKGNLTASGTTDLPTLVPSSGTWYFEIAGVSKTWTPPAAFPAAAGTYNFGQRPFSNSPTAPTLCTANLPTPAIVNPKKHFDVKLHTGTGVAQNITGVAFKPDLDWTKQRNSTGWHQLSDSVRGANRQLFSNDTYQEQTFTDRVTAFNSDGISVGTDSSVNGSGSSYVDWLWKAGGAAVTNNAGSIASQVSANVQAGFSIVTYTGTGAKATVGHGLGRAPELVIVKQRSGSGTNWATWVNGMLGTEYLLLNLTNAKAVDSSVWGSTTPDVSRASLGTNGTVNASGVAYVAYCFHSVDGYSKIGSYIGNGSTDGPFVHCGFKPRFLLVKQSSAAGQGWFIFDSVRNTYNVVNSNLYPNTVNPEETNTAFDFTSTGFKVRASGPFCNASGATYICYAIAETAAKYATAR